MQTEDNMYTPPAYIQTICTHSQYIHGQYVHTVNIYTDNMNTLSIYTRTICTVRPVKKKGERETTNYPQEMGASARETG
jgi:hypothetical protein